MIEESSFQNYHSSNIRIAFRPIFQNTRRRNELVLHKPCVLTSGDHVSAETDRLIGENLCSNSAAVD